MGTFKRKNKAVSADDYLRLAAEAPEGERYELFDGEAVLMAPPSYRHSLITAAFIGKFYSHLTDKPCRVVGQDLMVGFRNSPTVFIPDVVVLCKPEEWQNPEDKKILLNPTLIVEVQSPSTKKRDLEKAFRYQQIPSLYDLLLVSQDEPEILHVWREQEGGMTLTETLTQLTDVLDVERLGCKIELRRVYRDIFNEGGA